MKLFFMGKHGGSHPNERKDLTKGLSIEQATIPKNLIYPLSMHIGAPAEPVVSVGDKVHIGTLLAKAPGRPAVRPHTR